MHNIETINKLLIDELSAVESYQQALDKLRQDVSLSESEHLRPIYQDHKVAVSSLQTLSRSLGGTPTKNSGAWVLGQNLFWKAPVFWVPTPH